MERNFSNISTVNTSYYLIPLKISLTLISTILNGYIIGLFVLVIKSNTYSNWLFFCGVLADFMIGAISVPFFTIYTTFGNWPLGKSACIVWLVTDSSAGSISVYSPLIIAVHRYLQIVRPLKVSERMTTWKYAMIAAFWLITYTFWALVVIVPNVQDDRALVACSVVHRFALVLVADVLFYLAPVSFVLIVNSMIFYELMKRGRKQQQQRIKGKSFFQVDSKESNKCIVVRSSELVDDANEITKNKNNNKSNSISCVYIHIGSGMIYQRKRLKELRAMVCLYVVAGALIIFFAWFCITWPIRAYCDSCVSELVLNTGYWLSYTYPCLNPILLLIFHDKFKTEFFKSIRLIRAHCCF